MKLTPFVVAALMLSACAQADEGQQVRAAIQRQIPNIVIRSVKPTPYKGLYEVVTGGQIIYTNEKAEFYFLGNLVDAKSRRDLTEERMNALTSVKFDALPLNLAMKEVKGDGSRKLAVFSDPDCPYCHRLEQELTKVNNVTIYTFLYPIASLHPHAPAKAAAIWCAKDPVAAWHAWMLKGVMPQAAGRCDTSAITKVQALGDKLNITGTPTLFFANGRRVPGAVPADTLEKLLNASNK